MLPTGNVIERIGNLYPRAWAFTLRNRPAGGAVARLRLPWQAAPAARSHPEAVVAQAGV